MGATRRARVTSRFYVRVTGAQPVWQFFPRTVKPAEMKLGPGIAELVHQHPNFLNLADAGTVPFRVVLPLAEIADVRSPVFLAVQESGGLYIVGCPDESGPGAYTTLVADILAASTRMWRMSYEQFSRLFAETEGVELEELMLARSSADWDFEQFQTAVSANLEKGRFPILIVTAEPEGEVRQVLDYLNGMNLNAGLVSYSFWASGGIVVLEPVQAAGAADTGATKSQPAAVYWGPLEPPAAPAAPPPPPEPPPAEPPAEPATRIGAGAVPTEPAKKIAKPPSPGTKPGVMSGKRPPPKPRNSSGGAK
ncbi:MAG: hypothetical protein ABIK38_03035 [candidate division WOR-3 bacterium]